MAGATPMTPERKRAILNVWVENPTATYGEICKKANIGRATFYELRQQKPFMDEYHRLCQQKFDEAESLAMQKLIELANEGNWQAVKYLLDGKGYKPEEKSKVSVEGAAAINLTIGGEDDADNKSNNQ